MQNDYTPYLIQIIVFLRYVLNYFSQLFSFYFMLLNGYMHNLVYLYAFVNNFDSHQVLIFYRIIAN